LTTSGIEPAIFRPVERLATAYSENTVKTVKKRISDFVYERQFTEQEEETRRLLNKGEKIKPGVIWDKTL
jgi:hypothetical protein